MKKLLLSLLTSLVLASSAGASTLDTISKSTTVLNAYVGDVWVSRCTAEFISPNMIVTAEHCAGGDNYTIGFPIKEYKAEPIEASVMSDIMVLYSPEYNSPYYVDITPTFLKSSLDEVTSICYFGEATEQTKLSGYVVGEGPVKLIDSDDPSNTKVIRAISITFRTEEGCSGGGLYHQIAPNDYRLIAVDSGYSDKGSIYTYPDNLFAVLAIAQSKL